MNTLARVRSLVDAKLEGKSQEELRDVFDSVQFVASKHKGYNFGAATFNRLPTHKQIDHFNRVLVPLHQKINPKNNLEFTTHLLKQWSDRNSAESKAVDEDYGKHIAKESMAENWAKEDSITHRHIPSGMRVVKMADDTWSVSTGPVEDIETGRSKWIAHKHRTLNDAKSSVGIHYRRLKTRKVESNSHHDLITKIGFKHTGDDTYSGDHMDKGTLTRLHYHLQHHGYRSVSHSNIWTHGDGTQIHVTRNTPEGSTLKIIHPGR